MRKRSVLLLLAVLICVSVGLRRLERGHEEQEKKQLEEALRRAAVMCYASEGFYPPGVEYMVEHYGLRYDPDDYHVHYEVFASNLMPDISVLRIQP